MEKGMTGNATVDIRCPADVFSAERAVRDTALKIGFARSAAEEIALAAHELGTNILLHAGSGALEIGEACKEDINGLRISASDDGPGIADVENALQDGVSRRGSLGYGLGTVVRAMSEVDIRSPLSRRGGTRVECIRWLARQPDGQPGRCPLDIGAATRPHPGMKCNGDAFVIERLPGEMLTAVIDGLGHGIFANRAAQTARRYIEKFADRPFADIFRHVDRFCRPTRGVVMAVARVDWRERVLRFAGIGNIAVRLYGGAEHQSLYQLRGIVGSNAPLPRELSLPWPSNGILVLHSDGLSTRWRWSEHRHLFNRSATEQAGAMMHSLAKDNDDATIVVVKDRQ
jgi:anti-sigma regulatory factor (Ser/Thr protein kinase)